MKACPTCGFSAEPTAASTPTRHDPNLQSIDTELRLAGLEAEIVHVRELLLQLEKKRILFRRERNARISPILQLPPEVSSEIFELCLDSQRLFLQKSSEDNSMKPLLFGKICSAWRELAWSIPALWCNIKLSLGGCHVIDPVLVEGCLIRAGKRPLSIHLSQRYIRKPPPTYLESKIMDIIAKHSDRWRAIFLGISPMWHHALDRIEGHLPNLQSLSIDGFRMAERPSNRSLRTFRLAPQLQSVHLEDCDLHSIILPTDQLRQIGIDGQVVDSCVNMLYRCPFVIDCTFLCVTNQPGGQKDISADHLESLHMSFESTDAASAMFDALIVPAIRELSCSSEDQFPHSSFISLMKRSSCSLHTLHLDNWMTSGLELLDCLHAIPSLQKLTLKYIETSMNEILQRLHPYHPSNANPSSYVMPNLHTLECFTDDLDFVTLESFLRSRWDDRGSISSKANSDPPSITRLQSVRFETEGQGVPDTHTLAQLQRLVKEGMDIELSTPSGKCL